MKKKPANKSERAHMSNTNSGAIKCVVPISGGKEHRIKVSIIEDNIGKSVFTSKGALQRNNKDQMRLFDDSSSGCRVCDI